MHAYEFWCNNPHELGGIMGTPQYCRSALHISCLYIVQYRAKSMLKDTAVRGSSWSKSKLQVCRKSCMWWTISMGSKLVKMSEVCLLWAHRPFHLTFNRNRRWVAFGTDRQVIRPANLGFRRACSLLACQITKHTYTTFRNIRFGYGTVPISTESAFLCKRDSTQNPWKYIGNTLTVAQSKARRRTKPRRVAYIYFGHTVTASVRPRSPQRSFHNTCTSLIIPDGYGANHKSVFPAPPSSPHQPHVDCSPNCCS